MSDKILRLYCRKKCETCKGKGKVMTTMALSDTEVIRITGGMIGKCPDCTEGYTGSVMEFQEVTVDEDLYWFQSKEGYIIPHGLPIRVTSPYKTPKLNPTHLEVIELKECDYDDCRGTGKINQGLTKCPNCHTTGKIEVVTQWTKFGMGKDEYDEALIQKIKQERKIPSRAS